MLTLLAYRISTIRARALVLRYIKIYTSGKRAAEAAALQRIENELFDLPHPIYRLSRPDRQNLSAGLGRL